MDENGQSSQDGRAPVCDRCICTCGTGDWCRGTKHWFDHAQRLATEYRALREGKAAAARRAAEKIGRTHLGEYADEKPVYFFHEVSVDALTNIILSELTAPEHEVECDGGHSAKDHAPATGEDPCEHGCQLCGCAYYRPAPERDFEGCRFAEVEGGRIVPCWRFPTAFQERLDELERDMEKLRRQRERVIHAGVLSNAELAELEGK